MNIQIHLEIDPDLSGFMSIYNFWIDFQFNLDVLFVLLTRKHIQIYLDLNPDKSGFLTIPYSRLFCLINVYSNILLQY